MIKSRNIQKELKMYQNIKTHLNTPYNWNNDIRSLNIQKELKIDQNIKTHLNIQYNWSLIFLLVLA